MIGYDGEMRHGGVRAISACCPGMFPAIRPGLSGVNDGGFDRMTPAYGMGFR
jgi:hypothetical protein